MKQRTRLSASLAAASLLALATTSASAAGGVWNSTVGPGSGTGANGANPWIAAPAGGSLYVEWNVFTDDANASLIVDSTPDIAISGLGAGTATMTETTGASFLTSGGNIYSPGAATAFTLSMPGGVGSVFDVFLRASSVGSELSTIATLNGVQATRVESFTENITGGFGGTEKEWYWTWSTPSAATYDFAFVASTSSVSLDQVAVYAAPVPEPSTYAMLAIGLVGLSVARAKRARR